MSKRRRWFPAPDSPCIDCKRIRDGDPFFARCLECRRVESGGDRLGSTLRFSCDHCAVEVSYPYEGGPKRYRCDVCIKYALDWKNHRLSGPAAHTWRSRGRCDVCGVSKSGVSNGGLRLDHDHSTGRVRGLLCNGCNTAVGYARENSKTLRSLADYLDQA